MPKTSETRRLPYAADDMFALVADVERYPEFLPWCAASRVRGVHEKRDFRDIDVDMVISFKVFRERFGSRARLWHDRSRIETDYLDGPFEYLHSCWTFRDVDGGSEVSFEVDFEFRNAVLRKLIGVVFTEAMHRIVRAFEERAAQLYG